MARAFDGLYPDDSVENIWFAGVFCNWCKAARLMQWRRNKNDIAASRPQHAVEFEDFWVAIHCDYFKRRVELPEDLEFCHAVDSDPPKTDKPGQASSKARHKGR